jgi:hypothetical protein
MRATKTTIVLANAILLSFTAPITVFTEDEKSDHHDDDNNNKHHDDKKLYCYIVDHDYDHHDNEKHDDDEKTERIREKLGEP